MKDFKMYNLGGSCCQRRIDNVNGVKIFIKEIEKKIEGVENGFTKFFYEIEHMRKYQELGLFPEIYYVDDKDEKYTVGMEFCCNGVTLSDLLRNTCIDMELFKHALSYIIEELFGRLYSDVFPEKPDARYLEKCYYSRVEKRIKYVFEQGLIEKYHFSDTLYWMVEKGCVINGEFYPPISQYLEYMRKSDFLSEVLMIDSVCNIHYDLCPLNILVELDLAYKKITSFKLIDVRGEQETGRNVRHYMYDMGKMLLGLDCFDLFRIFNGKGEKKSYLLNQYTNDIPQFDFSLLPDGMAARYKEANDCFWELMNEKQYYSKMLKQSADKLRRQYLFSRSMMYHPDIPCRIIYEHDEEMAILFFIRGMMMIRNFLEEVLGEDPVGKFNGKIDLWNGISH